MKQRVFIIVIAVAAFMAQTRKADDAGWTTYGLSSSEARYSPLADINAQNVRRLNAVWSYDVGSGGGGQEATPVVANGTIYGITNWSLVFAVDARTGKEKWRWDPEVNQTTVRARICCGQEVGVRRTRTALPAHRQQRNDGPGERIRANRRP